MPDFFILPAREKQGHEIGQKKFKNKINHVEVPSGTRAGQLVLNRRETVTVSLWSVIMFNHRQFDV